MASTRVRRIGAGALVAVALSGAACSQQADRSLATGGDETTTTAAPTTEGAGRVGESLGQLTPAASARYLSQAAEKTSALSTGTFSMTMSVDGMPGVASGSDFVKMQGAFDNAANRARMTMDMSGAMSGFGGSGSTGGAGLDQMFGDLFGEPIEMVVDGQTAYMRWAMFSQLTGAETPWISFSAPEGSAGSANPLGTATGDTYLQFIRGAGEEVTEVGKETVDGVTTTHYSTTIDLKALAEQSSDQIPADQREHLDQALAQFKGTAELPVDVWIGDEDNQIRRLQMTMDFSQFGGMDGLTGAGAGKLGDVSMVMTIDFSDLGAPVDITVPPADQVTQVDPSELSGGALGGLGGGRSGRGGRTTSTTTN